MARARVVPRRPRRLFRRLWLAERRTFRQGLVALGLSTAAGSLGRGRFFDALPWIGMSIHV